MSGRATDDCNDNHVHRDYPAAYAAWRQATLTGSNALPELVEKVDATMKENAETLVGDFRKRLEDPGSGDDAGSFSDNPQHVSLWDILLALELADPTSTYVYCTILLALDSFTPAPPLD